MNKTGSKFVKQSNAFDPVTAKKDSAKKRALKIVGDAFSNERKIDNDINSRREKIGELLNKIGDARKSIGALEKSRAELRGFYGVAEDSDEEQDLKLLEKEFRKNMPGSKVQLTAEENARLAEIKENGLSEYQQRSMELLEFESPFLEEAYEAEKGIYDEERVINGIKLERLKHHPILDAAKQADEIMDEASKEIVKMIVDEAKENIDKKVEEEKEKAKAEKEKKEEIEEKMKSAKEKRKANARLTEELIENAAEVTSIATDVREAQQEVKEMLNKMKLIEDDIKGSAVDENL
ncbi:MAG: hypothetical protein K6F63_00110 [Lachnospiraceae bacterium]|nr:hypothetical protein [Lachnospiraceae bacterium]